MQSEAPVVVEDIDDEEDTRVESIIVELPTVITQPVKPVSETLVKELRAQTIVSPPSPKQETEMLTSHLVVSQLENLPTEKQNIRKEAPVDLHYHNVVM